MIIINNISNINLEQQWQQNKLVTSSQALQKESKCWGRRVSKSKTDVKKTLKEDGELECSITRLGANSLVEASYMKNLQLKCVRDVRNNAIGQRKNEPDYETPQTGHVIKVLLFYQMSIKLLDISIKNYG